MEKVEGRLAFNCWAAKGGDIVRFALNEQQYIDVCFAKGREGINVIKSGSLSEPLTIRPEVSNSIRVY